MNTKTRENFLSPTSNISRQHVETPPPILESVRKHSKGSGRMSTHSTFLLLPGASPKTAAVRQERHQEIGKEKWSKFLNIFDVLHMLIGTVIFLTIFLIKTYI